MHSGTPNVNKKMSLKRLLLWSIIASMITYPMDLIDNTVDPNNVITPPLLHVFNLFIIFYVMSRTMNISKIVYRKVIEK